MKKSSDNDEFWRTIKRYCDLGAVPIDARSLCADEEKLDEVVSSVPLFPPSGTMTMAQQVLSPGIGKHFSVVLLNADSGLVPVSVCCVENYPTSGFQLVLGFPRELGYANCYIILQDNGIAQDGGKRLFAEKGAHLRIPRELVLAAVNAVAMMNVRNVQMTDVVAPRHIRKRHAKNGITPFIRYKMLAVKPLAESESKRGKGPAYVPLHRVRMHLRYYSYEKPLFGKYEGWFIVPPHMRGNPQFGEVRKGYRPEQDKEVA